MPEQAGPRAVAAATDQREQLRLFAGDISVRLERVGPLVEVLVTAAARTEPSSPGCWRRSTASGSRTSRTFVDALAANGPLRLEPEAALDTVWALASPELHRLLTRTRGWTRERYCGWLADSLAAILL